MGASGRVRRKWPGPLERAEVLTQPRVKGVLLWEHGSLTITFVSLLATAIRGPYAATGCRSELSAAHQPRPH